MADFHGNYIENLRIKIDNWLKSEIGKNNRWNKYIKYTPDLFHLLIRLSVDKTLPNTCKANLAAAISYFVSPYDFIPEEFWGALGYVDDIALAALVIRNILEEVEIQALAVHWTANTDLVNLVNEILEVAEEMVGKQWWDKLLEIGNSCQ